MIICLHQVSKLSNGVTVASLEHYNVTSKVGVFIRAGSRYEGYSHRGVTHLLRHCVSTVGVTIISTVCINDTIYRALVV